MSEKRTPSLLEALAKCAGCSFLSDLRYIKEDAQWKLGQMLEATATEDYPPRDWNDARSYLVSPSPPVSPEEARQKLLCHYRPNEAPPLLHNPQGGIDYEKK